MDIQKVLLGNKITNNQGGVNSISNVWLYILCLMKSAVASDEIGKDSVSDKSEELYEKFQEQQEKFDEITNKLKNVDKNSLNTIQPLQNEQNQIAMKLKDLQSQMRSLWQVQMSNVSNNEYLHMQQGYKAIDDMYKNNPATKGGR